MTGQYELSKEACKKILKILDEHKIYYMDGEREESEWGSGIFLPYHVRDVKIVVCSREDEEEEYKMYVEID